MQSSSLSAWCISGSIAPSKSIHIIAHDGVPFFCGYILFAKYTLSSVITGLALGVASPSWLLCTLMLQ